MAATGATHCPPEHSEASDTRARPSVAFRSQRSKFACRAGRIGEHREVLTVEAAPTSTDAPVNGPTDAELLRQYRRHGDDAAFGRIMARHADDVRRAALRATGNATAAEDVAQATFLVLTGRLSSAARSSGPRQCGRGIRSGCGRSWHLIFA